MSWWQIGDDMQTTWLQRTDRIDEQKWAESSREGGLEGGDWRRPGSIDMEEELHRSSQVLSVHTQLPRKPPKLIKTWRNWDVCTCVCVSTRAASLLYIDWGVGKKRKTHQRTYTTERIGLVMKKQKNNRKRSRSNFIKGTVPITLKPLLLVRRQRKKKANGI